MLRHFNETASRGPDTEGGGGDDLQNVSDIGDTGGDSVDSGDSGTDAGESGEGSQTLSVREEIKKAWSEASEEQQQPKAKKDKTTGRFQKAAAPEGQQTAPAVASTATPAPASLSTEAKAAWEQTPEPIKAAFVKREADMQKGVDELKQKYSLIDQAISPHTDALRQMNATPGEAVNRMFLWFKALANSPQQAFPELAKSMGLDWTKLVAQPGVTQGTQQAAPATGAPEIPEPIKQYVGSLEKQIKDLSGVVQQVYGGFTGIQQNLQTQNQARINENLSIWSKDKPYFEDVRQVMAQLIESGVVPLKEGQVDLDTAYERAIYFNPEVRSKVLAEQQQANQAVQQQTQQAATTAQQTQVNKARKAAVSLPVNAPVNNKGPVTSKRKPGERTSVKQSLLDAVQQLRDQ